MAQAPTTKLLDYRDTDDLQAAYEQSEGDIKETAKRFAVGIQTVRARLIETGIHVPEPDRVTDPEDDLDYESTTVKATIKAYQKREWEAHAEHLGMSSLSQFVSCMVQAGRRGFVVWDAKTEHAKNIRQQLLEAVEDRESVTYDDLTGIIEAEEDEIEGILNDLQNSNEIAYSGRRGGYVLST